MHRTVIAVLLTVTVLSLIAAACSSAQAGAAGDAGMKSGAGPMSMAPVSALPREMQAAPARVRTAYQFAVANPDALKNVPCYCGCGAIGHTSNLSCYVKEMKDGKVLAFDDHALGCSLCVDISQEVVQMTGEGRPAADIRAQILADFSKFGPANQ